MGTFRGIELDDVELESERLLLRRWRPEDADAVFEIMQDRSMYRFLALPDPYSRDVAWGFVTSIGHEGRAEGTGLGCAVVERWSGRMVGSAALRLAAGGELGYWVRPSARGHGYATEAVRTLAEWAFSIGVERLRVLCDTRNLSSVHTALAAGFRYEGIGRGLLPDQGDPANAISHCDLARFARLTTDSGLPETPAFPRLPPAGLRDSELALRLVLPDDAVGLLETDDVVSASWGFDGQRLTLDAARRVAANAGLLAIVGPNMHLAMLDVASGAFAGEVNLRMTGPPQVVGVGYAVHPYFRGRGYTARALRLIVPWAFETAGFARLELGAKTGNVASQRAAASAGFEPDGVRRGRLRNPDGTFGDEVRYALANPALG